jgi:hypothetical protein
MKSAIREGLELLPVVVEAEGNARALEQFDGLALLGHARHHFRDRLDRAAGAGDEAGDAQRLAMLDELGGVVVVRHRHVRAAGGQPEFVEDCAQFAGGHAMETGEFHRLVTDLRHLLQGGDEIVLAEVAEGIQLKSNGFHRLDLFGEMAAGRGDLPLKGM